MTELQKEQRESNSEVASGDAPLIEKSPLWSRTTKTIVFVIALLLIALIAWRFQQLIGRVVTAAVLAYVLNPVIKLLDENTPLSRATLILIIYFALILVIMGAFTALGVAAYGQILNLLDRLPEFVVNLVAIVRELTEQEMVILGRFEISMTALDWASIRNQLLGYLEPFISRGGQYAGQLATTTLRILGTFLFIWIISIYLALEIPRMGDYVGRPTQQLGYRQDAERLMSEFGNIWSAYLRGQIILGLVVGVAVGLSLGLLGVQNALALGILSGLLEFIPVLGPIIGTGAALVVAFFQPSNYLGLSSVQFALLVLAVMFLIQQLENHVLVPYIVGDALDLHPLLVIIGVFMGASIAGALGAILAAPILASLKLLSIYAWRKMFDLPPFPEEEPDADGRSLLAWRERLILLLRGPGAREEPTEVKR
ncbi:MAG TPA: AI-2E family transporter [Candidatus Sulfomarinibacteraceae bacterium]|nr:AI-2E family transporter [Candidatus Sulfomarinibacteraceae bacterium]